MTLHPRLIALAASGALLAGGLLAAPGPALAAGGQTVYTTTDPARPIPDGSHDGAPGAAVSQLVTVSGAGTVVDHLEVGVTIDHTYTGDLRLSVTAPDGTRVDLAYPNNQSADVDGLYVFTDDAATTFVQASTEHDTIPPGDYRASKPTLAGDVAVDLDGVFSQVNPNGVWTISAQDSFELDTGTLRSSYIALGVASADTTAPGVSITSGPADGATVTSEPSYEFSSSDVDVDHYECAVDDDTFATCTSPYTVDVPGLPDGEHVFKVRAVDTSDNTGAAVTRGFILDAVDTEGPTASITSGPTNGEEVGTLPTYQFSSSDADVARFECAVSADPSAAGTFSTCTSPYTVQGIAPGKYAFFVRAVDTSGNTGTAAMGSFLWHNVACDDATAALTAAQADLVTAKNKVEKAKVRLAKARKSGNPAKIKKAKKKLAAAKAHLADVENAVDDAQAQVDQDC